MRWVYRQAVPESRGNRRKTQEVARLSQWRGIGATKRRRRRTKAEKTVSREGREGRKRGRSGTIWSAPIFSELWEHAERGGGSTKGEKTVSREEREGRRRGKERDDLECSDVFGALGARGAWGWGWSWRGNRPPRRSAPSQNSERIEYSRWTRWGRGRWWGRGGGGWEHEKTPAGWAGVLQKRKGKDQAARLKRRRAIRPARPRPMRT